MAKPIHALRQIMAKPNHALCANHGKAKSCALRKSFIHELTASRHDLNRLRFMISRANALHELNRRAIREYS